LILEKFIPFYFLYLILLPFPSHGKNLFLSKVWRGIGIGIGMGWDGIGVAVLGLAMVSAFFTSLLCVFFAFPPLTLLTYSMIPHFITLLIDSASHYIYAHFLTNK